MHENYLCSLASLKYNGALKRGLPPFYIFTESNLSSKKKVFGYIVLIVVTLTVAKFDFHKHCVNNKCLEIRSIKPIKYKLKKMLVRIFHLVVQAVMHLRTIKTIRQHILQYTQYSECKSAFGRPSLQFQKHHTFIKYHCNSTAFN